MRYWSLVPRRIQALRPPIAVVVACVALATTASPAIAQNTDSLAAILATGTIAARAEAIVTLRTIPGSQWGGAARTALFVALISEGRRTTVNVPNTDVEQSELRGSYQIELVRVALELNDPRALEGMVWMGLQTTEQAITFIVARGEVALPFLEEAWRAEEWRRPDILSTATRMLAQGGGLSQEARTRLTRIQITASGFEWALEPSVESHPEFIGAIAFDADSGRDVFQRNAAAQVLVKLRVRAAAQGPVELWSHVDDFLGAACGPQDHGRCEQLRHLWPVVDAHLRGSRWTAALNAIDAFVGGMGAICSDTGRAAECRVLLGNASIVRAMAQERAQR